MVVVVDAFHRAVRYVVAVMRDEIIVSVHQELLDDASVGVGQGIEPATRLVAPVTRAGLKAGRGNRQVGIFHLQGGQAAILVTQ